MASSSAPNPATASGHGVQRPTSIDRSSAKPAPRSSYTSSDPVNEQAGKPFSRSKKRRHHELTNRLEEGMSESNRRAIKRAHKSRSSDGLPNDSMDRLGSHGSEVSSRSKESDEARRARKHARKAAKGENGRPREAARASATADGDDAGAGATATVTARSSSAPRTSTSRNHTPKSSTRPTRLRSQSPASDNSIVFVGETPRRKGTDTQAPSHQPAADASAGNAANFSTAGKSMPRPAHATPHSSAVGPSSHVSAPLPNTFDPADQHQKKRKSNDPTQTSIPRNDYVGPFAPHISTFGISASGPSTSVPGAAPTFAEPPPRTAPSALAASPASSNPVHSSQSIPAASQHTNGSEVRGSSQSGQDILVPNTQPPPTAPPSQSSDLADTSLGSPQSRAQPGPAQPPAISSTSNASAPSLSTVPAPRAPTAPTAPTKPLTQPSAQPTPTQQQTKSGGQGSTITQAHASTTSRPSSTQSTSVSAQSRPHPNARAAAFIPRHRKSASGSSTSVPSNRRPSAEQPTVRTFGAAAPLPPKPASGTTAPLPLKPVTSAPVLPAALVGKSNGGRTSGQHSSFNGNSSAGPTASFNTAPTFSTSAPGPTLPAPASAPPAPRPAPSMSTLSNVGPADPARSVHPATTSAPSTSRPTPQAVPAASAGGPTRPPPRQSDTAVDRSRGSSSSNSRVSVAPTQAAPETALSAGLPVPPAQAEPKQGPAKPKPPAFHTTLRDALIETWAQQQFSGSGASHTQSPAAGSTRSPLPPQNASSTAGTAPPRVVSQEPSPAPVAARTTTQAAPAPTRTQDSSHLSVPNVSSTNSAGGTGQSRGGSHSLPPDPPQSAAHGNTPSSRSNATFIRWNNVHQDTTSEHRLILRPSPYDPLGVSQQASSISWSDIFIPSAGRFNIPSDFPEVIDKPTPVQGPAYNEEQDDPTPRVGFWFLPPLEPERKVPLLRMPDGFDRTALLEGLEEGDELDLVLKGQEDRLPVAPPASAPPAPPASLPGPPWDLPAAQNLFSQTSPVARYFIIKRVQESSKVPPFLRLPLINALQGVPPAADSRLASKNDWVFDLDWYRKPAPGSEPALDGTYDKCLLLLTTSNNQANYCVVRADPLISHLVLNDLRLSPWYDADGHLVDGDSGSMLTDSEVNIPGPRMAQLRSAYDKEERSARTAEAKADAARKALHAKEDILRQQREKTASNKADIERETVRTREVEASLAQAQRDLQEAQAERASLASSHAAKQLEINRAHAATMAAEQREAMDLMRQIKELQSQNTAHGDQVRREASLIAYDQQAQKLLEADVRQRQAAQEKQREEEIQRSQAVLSDPAASDDAKFQARLRLTAMGVSNTGPTPQVLEQDEPETIDDELAALAAEAEQFE